MIETYTCELQTEAAHFARWFHMRIAECVYCNGMKELTIDDGHGRARFDPLPDFGNDYLWRVIDHDGYPDQAPEIAAELLALLKIDERRVSFRAIPLAPSRLKVELYCAGAELLDVWRCLLAHLATDYRVTPAVDQVQRNKGGNPGRRAHRDAIQRLQDGEDRNVNYQTWLGDYTRETGEHPDTLGSGGTELYKKRVWQAFQRRAK